MKILVINCGSSSVKYRLFDILSKKKHALLAKGVVEKLNQAYSLFSHEGRDAESIKNLKIKSADHRRAIKLIIYTLTEDLEHRVLSDKNDIDAIGHRVVHGAEEFHEATLIDDKVLKSVKSYSKLAPLHNPPNIEGIKAARKIFPDIAQVAVFDTAFHQSLPPQAYIYGLPYRYYTKYHIRRYGFHGTSHRYVAYQAAQKLKKPLSKLNIITCHLGNGCSITAVSKGKSVDTSMGFTPLEGLLMGTRCGDIDPAVVLYVMNKEKLSPHQMDNLLNKNSGLMGLSGVSSDMRDIRTAVRKGNELAKIAYDIFIYRIKKYIGAYAAAMGRVDAIVFTAGIGENVKEIRQHAMQGLRGLFKNKVKVMAIATDEEYMIARDTYELVRKL